MIQRDGALTSLWQATTTKSRESYISNRMLAQDEPFDVVIVGGGITGVSTGLLLQEAGFRCIIVEANTLCFGTTGGTTAHLNTILDTPYPTIVKNFGQEKAALVARAVEEAIGLVRSNCEKYSIDAEMEKQTAYLFSQTDEQTAELEEIRKVSAELGLKAGIYGSDPCRPGKTKGAGYLRSGQVSSDALCIRDGSGFSGVGRQDHRAVQGDGSREQ